jgi:dTDP-4-amino-4,6-dideoxygalactose transaminase
VRAASTPPDTEVHGHHIFPIWVDAVPRDRFVKHLLTNRVGTVVNYLAMHLLTWFRENMGTKWGNFPVAEEIGDKVLSLPFYLGMPVDHIDQVCTHIEAAVAANLRSPQSRTGYWLVFLRRAIQNGLPLERNCGLWLR